MNGLEELDKIFNVYEYSLADGYSGHLVSPDRQEELLEPIRKELKDGEKYKKALDIIKSHAKEIKHFKYLRFMAKYWEENKTEVTEELLYNYDFPYTIDEFNLLKEVMK